MISNKRIISLVLSGMFFTGCSSTKQFSFAEDNITQPTTQLEIQTDKSLTVNIETQVPTSNTLKPEVSKEQQILNDFETIKDNIIQSLKDNGIKALEYAKNGFVTIVDFIFYDATINGITFNELSEEDKNKVLNLVNSIDEEIIDYFPNYKEDIAIFTKESISKISELIKLGTTNFNEFLKESLSAETYEILNGIKNTVTETAIDIKDEALDLAQEGIENITDVTEEGFSLVKDWYDDIRN